MLNLSYILWSAENTNVAGRPGQRRPRQALPGANPPRRPLHVRAVLARPLRLQHHPVLHRLQRRAVVGLAAQLTRGELPPSRARPRPRTLHRTRRQAPRETRPLLLHQTRSEQEVRRPTLPHPENQRTALQIRLGEACGVDASDFRDSRGLRRPDLRKMQTQKARQRNRVPS